MHRKLGAAGAVGHDLLGASQAKEAASALARYRSVLEHAWFRFAADNDP